MANKEGLWACGVCLALLATTALAEPPALIGPSGEAPDESAIEQRVAYWITTIGTAESSEQIVDAQEQLARDYDVLTQPQNRYKYASEVASGALRLLGEPDASDPLRVNRELNIAMAVAAMDQVSIQRALRVLVAHPNEGVRFWGWKGYGKSLAVLLAQGGESAQAVFQDVQEHAANETVPLVWSAIFDMFNLPVSLPDTVSADVWDAAAAKFLAALFQQWDPLCGHVQAGDEASIHTAGKGVAALARLSRFDSNGPATTKAMQSLVNMMWAAYKAYDQEAEHDPNVDVAAAVIVACEQSLKGLSGISEEPVKNALTKTSFKVGDQPVRLKSKAQRSPFVGDAVLTWISKLEERGVVKPGPKPSGEEAETDSAPTETETDDADG